MAFNIFLQSEINAFFSFFYCAVPLSFFGWFVPPTLPPIWRKHFSSLRRTMM
jgi:hypothetical protein